MRSRSLLYVPGDQPDKLAGCLGRGADGVIVDLEDAVPLAGKAAARSVTTQWLAGLDTASTQVWVRINPGMAGFADVDAVAALPSLTGIVVAKSESAAHLAAVSARLDACGSDAALAPLIESAAALWGIEAIARAPRVARLQIGEADLRAELGIDPGDDERELLWLRSRVVVASAAAGLRAPIAPASTQIRHLDRLRASTDALRRLGFGGRTCIHPAQLAVVNEVFTPSDAEVAGARDLLARFEAAGGAPIVDAAGRMVDLAVVKRARAILETEGGERG